MDDIEFGLGALGENSDEVAILNPCRKIALVLINPQLEGSGGAHIRK